VREATHDSDDKIVVISVRGVISGGARSDLGDDMVEDTKGALRQASEDDDVKAIVLAVDSPGGEVTASDAIYNAVRNARKTKPVVVCMESLAASGGYYISCGGSWIIANDTSITGSIGVIIQTMKYKELFGKIGVEAQTFKSGKFKDILSGSRDMTEEERAYIQTLVMQTYEKFLGIVATERGLPADELRSGIADGRIISGKDALGFKLVNQLGYIEDAYDKARELGGAPGASVVRYQSGFSISRALRFLGESQSSKMKIELDASLLPRLEPGRLYMLPSYFAQ
jgi:protease-4